MLRALVALCLLALPAMAALGGLGAPAADAARAPTLAPNEALIDGPSADITALSGMSIARDGTGGLVYLKDVLGVPHVFVSRLLNGSFQPPVQADAGLAGASSQPVIAAGQGGLLLVAFVNGGGLYVAGAGGAATALGAPGAIYPAAANPSISMSNLGKAYLAFTATDGAGGGDVRTAYYFGGAWSLESAPFDLNPADAAGTGTARPTVSTSGDGTGIVAWGENGHIYTRRVVKTTPSAVAEQADPATVDGWQETSASLPDVATGGDSSYASVAFQEEFANGGTRQSRVLVNRLHASQYDGFAEADAITIGGPEGADQPQVAVTEYGGGWVTSEHDASHALFTTGLGTNESIGGVGRVDSEANDTNADAVPGIAGLVSTFIAWQQDPGIAGPAEIRLRFAPNGSDLGAEQVISSSALGATNADLGLQTGGDVSGDAAVAWVQGSGAATRIVAAQLYQPPGGFTPAHAFAYADSARPLVAWSGAAELWGSPVYVVRVDGVAVGQTTATQMTLPAPLANGRHAYQVVAVNQAGLSSTAKAATVLVDTLPPRVSLTVTGQRYVKVAQRLRVTYSDRVPPGQPASSASGVQSVSVGWGDSRATSRIARNTATHTYKRKGTYKVTITAFDRAGNRTVVTRKIKIIVKPKQRRPKHKTQRHAVRAALIVSR